MDIMGNFPKMYEYTDPETGETTRFESPNKSVGISDLKDMGIIKDSRPLHKSDMHDGWAGCTDMDGYVMDMRSCYLTTATMNAQQENFNDNCYELEMMRKFRDEDLLKSPEGTNAVNHYYDVAPEIVTKINSMENSKEIWSNAYGEIKNIVADLEAGDKNSAFNRYTQMTRELELI